MLWTLLNFHEELCCDSESVITCHCQGKGSIHSTKLMWQIFTIGDGVNEVCCLLIIISCACMHLILNSIDVSPSNLSPVAVNRGWEVEKAKKPFQPSSYKLQGIVSCLLPSLFLPPQRKFQSNINFVTTNAKRTSLHVSIVMFESKLIIKKIKWWDKSTWQMIIKRWTKPFC